MEGTTLVSLDPTLLSELIAKLIRATVAKKRRLDKGNPQGSPPTSIAESQLENIWGTDKVGAYDFSPSLVFTIMKRKRLVVAVGEQQILVPHFVKGYEGDRVPPCYLEADVKRVYEFDYLPQCLLSQLMCVLTEEQVGEAPFSFSNPATLVDPTAKQSFKAGEGQVTLWSQGFLYEAVTSGLRVDQVREGPEVPFCGGRLCFHVWGSLDQQAQLLRMACTSLNEVRRMMSLYHPVPS